GRWQGSGQRPDRLPRLRRGGHARLPRYGLVPVRLPHALVAADRGVTHRPAAHRPRFAQLRQVLLLRRRQGQARLDRPHRPAAYPAQVRSPRGQRHGRRRAQPVGDLERRTVVLQPRDRARQPTGPGAAQRADRMTAVEPAPHVSVMPAEVIEQLAVTPGAWYVDCTFGAGGHARKLLELGAKVLAIDQDPLAATFLTADESWARATTRGDLRFAQGNFRDLERHAFEQGVTGVAGVLLDLGVSSMQIDEGERGF